MGAGSPGADGNEREATARETLSGAEAELVYRCLPDELAAKVRRDALRVTVGRWHTARPDDAAVLDAAAEDPDSPFEWAGVEVAFESLQAADRPELRPRTGTERGFASVDRLARDFGWDYVAAVRDAVRGHQRSTLLSPREFVACVLSRAEPSREAAAAEMGVPPSEFGELVRAGVDPEIERARSTVALDDRLRGDG